MITFLNNKFLDANHDIASNDRGLLFGDGLFETIRAYQGQALFLKQHWERLLKTATFLQIPIPFNIEELIQIITELLHKNNLQNKDARIRITLTRGLNPKSRIAIPEMLDPTFLITAIPYYSLPAINNIIISNIKRNEFSPLANMKTLNYLDNILALQEAKQNGADDALFFNTHNKLACATTANIFMVKNNQLYTPPLQDGALPGIMRSVILQIAENLEITVAESSINIEELKTADELFLTNSLVGIRSIHHLLGQALTQDLSLTLQKALQEYIAHISP